MSKVAEMIRGENVEMALHILENSPQEAAIRLRKLLLSAIANWQAKNEGVRLEDGHLFVNDVMVDGGRSLKRVQACTTRARIQDPQTVEPCHPHTSEAGEETEKSKD